MTINLATGAVSGGDAAGDTFNSIEQVLGSNQGDQLTGDSGTSKFFIGHVLKPEKIAKSATPVSSIETMMDSIGNNKNAIGYAGMGAASEIPGKVKSLKLQLINGGTAVGATVESATGGYPLSRPLFVFMDHEPKPSAQKFVDFCLSPEGQKLVESAGYASIDRK